MINRRCQCSLVCLLSVSPSPKLAGDMESDYEFMTRAVLFALTFSNLLTNRIAHEDFDSSAY